MTSVDLHQPRRHNAFMKKKKKIVEHVLNIISFICIFLLSYLRLSPSPSISNHVLLSSRKHVGQVFIRMITFFLSKTHNNIIFFKSKIYKRRQIHIYWEECQLRIKDCVRPSSLLVCLRFEWVGAFHHRIHTTVSWWLLALLCCVVVKIIYLTSISTQKMRLDLAHSSPQKNRRDEQEDLYSILFIWLWDIVDIVVVVRMDVHTHKIKCSILPGRNVDTHKIRQQATLFHVQQYSASIRIHLKISHTTLQTFIFSLLSSELKLRMSELCLSKTMFFVSACVSFSFLCDSLTKLMSVIIKCYTHKVEETSGTHGHNPT